MQAVEKVHKEQAKEYEKVLKVRAGVREGRGGEGASSTQFANAAADNLQTTEGGPSV